MDAARASALPFDDEESPTGVVWLPEPSRSSGAAAAPARALTGSAGHVGKPADHLGALELLAAAAAAKEAEKRSAVPDCGAADDRPPAAKRSRTGSSAPSLPESSGVVALASVPAAAGGAGAGADPTSAAARGAAAAGDREPVERKRSSRFRGVCYNKQNKKWKAKIDVDNRERHLGYWEDEVLAAAAYDVACEENGRTPPNGTAPEIRTAAKQLRKAGKSVSHQPVARSFKETPNRAMRKAARSPAPAAGASSAPKRGGEQQKTERKAGTMRVRSSAVGRSGFRGVCYSKVGRKWQANIRVDRKLRHLGLFESVELAAAAHDAACIELGREPPNKTSKELQEAALKEQSHKPHHTSSYRGVSRARARRAWNATITLQGTAYRIGSFKEQRIAAAAFDAACVVHGREPVNETSLEEREAALASLPTKGLVVPSKKFEGVYRQVLTGKWVGEVNTDDGSYLIGPFSTEVIAAAAYDIEVVELGRPAPNRSTAKQRAEAVKASEEILESKRRNRSKPDGADGADA